MSNARNKAKVEISTPTAGTSNLITGANTGNSIISGGNYNTLVGDEAGTAVTTGDSNVAIGHAALEAATEASENVAVGKSALATNTTGFSNTSVGSSSLTTNLDGNYNSALGWKALDANSSGSENTAVGSNALGVNTIAGQNTAVGGNTLYNNTEGAQNTAVGYRSSFTNIDGGNNTSLGYYSLHANTTGASNTALGHQAGDNITSGDNNIIIGAGIDADSATADNQLNIGGFIKGASGAVTLNHSTSAKLATTSTGIDVTGTVTADGLVVENTAGATLNVNTGLSGTTSKLLLHEGSTASPANGATLQYDGAANLFSIGVGSSVDTKRLAIDRNTGDISFYEDTGTTPKFFWDASAESLGIGRTNPASPVSVAADNTGPTGVGYSGYGGTNTHIYSMGRDNSNGLGLSAYGTITFHPNSTTGFMSGNEAMRIDSSGTVTMPYQPAFQAKPSSDQNNIATDTAVTIAFGTEVFDVGSNFASNIFTAPVTGKYQLQVLLRLQNVDSAAYYYLSYINTSNGAYEIIFDPDFGQDASYFAVSGSVLADMDAGDTAIVQIYQGGGTPQTDVHTQSFFSGYLAC